MPNIENQSGRLETVVIEKPIVTGYGDVEAQGRRWEMEDGHTIIPSFRGNPNEFFAGVYDGHGGAQTAGVAQSILHRNLENQLSTHPPKLALKQAFLQTDREVKESGIKDGATAVVAYLDGTKLYVANAGDARAVLGRESEVKRLSHDHKANDPTEVKRIKAAGGYVTSRYQTGIPRVNGILAISRAIGDHDEELDGFISANPYITQTTLEPGDHTLILACDGIWDVMSDREAIELVKEFPNPREAAEELKDEAIKVRRSTDNVTVIVVKLDVPKNPAK